MINTNEIFKKSAEVRNRLFTTFCMPCYLNLEARMLHFRNENENNKDLMKSLMKQSLEVELSMFQNLEKDAGPFAPINNHNIEKIIDLIHEELVFINTSSW